MKKFLLMFTFAGLLIFTACGEKPKPEKADETPTMEQVLAEAQDPNDFTVNPFVGELVSLDNATKGDNSALTADAAAKMAADGNMLVVKGKDIYYIVINKADNTYAASALAPMAGKQIALYGMAKVVNGVNFFVMEKMEEAK